ncbi:MAG: GNAT family N-acetyltransferase [Saprospiraceae bacterium]|nr:GNAT family N-acetyltransferase [Saprospiraceae bacterium]
MTSDYTVRDARLDDIPAVLDLVRELAVYEKAPQAVTASLDTYRTCFQEGVYRALVAEADAGIVGTAIYYPTFSTWKGRMMYLEDFIVTEAQRGQGIGLLLFNAFLDRAKEAGAILCKWQVLHWNEPAIRFYERLPVIFDDEWIDVKYYF